MTLEEYYKAKENIQIPKGLSWEEEDKFYFKELEKLRSQLSTKDLNIVLENLRQIQERMQSEVGMPSILN